MAGLEKYTRRVADQLSDLSRRVGDLEVASVLPYATLPAESPIQVKNQAGETVALIGGQSDGTAGVKVLEGPTPPVPTKPTVEGEATLSVRLDGAFEHEAQCPNDFRAVEIWIIGSPEDLPPDSTKIDTNSEVPPAGGVAPDLFVGTINTRAGGAKTVELAPGTYNVALRCRAKSGKASALSPVVVAKVAGTATRKALDEAKGRIDAAFDHATKVGKDFEAEKARVDGELAKALGATDEVKKSVVAVTSQADNAKRLAEEAKTKADSASNTADDAKNSAEHLRGDMVEMGDEIDRFNRELPEAKNAAEAAKKAASEADSKATAAAKLAGSASEAASRAQTAADGKSKITRSTTTPSGAGHAGDVWWQYTDSSLVGKIIGQWVHDGTAWVKTDVGAEIVADLTVDKLKAGTGSFDRAVISKLISDNAFVDQLAASRIIVKGTNLLPDGDLAKADLAGTGWDKNVGLQDEYVAGGMHVALIFPPEHFGSSSTVANETRILFEPGRKYVLDFWVQASTSGAHGSIGFMPVSGGDFLHFSSPSISDPWTGLFPPQTWKELPTSWEHRRYEITPHGLVKPTFARLVAQCHGGNLMIAKLRVALDQETVIEDGSITTSKLAAHAVDVEKLNVTEGMAARIGEFLKIKFEQIQSSIMNAWMHLTGAGRIVLGGERTGSDANPTFSGARTELNAAGLQVYGPNQEEPITQISGQGEQRIALTSTDANGNVITGFGVSGDGNAVARELAVQRLIVGGEEYKPRAGSEIAVTLPNYTHTAGYQKTAVARIPLTLHVGDYQLLWSTTLRAHGGHQPYDAVGTYFDIIDVSGGKVTCEGEPVSWQTTFNKQQYTNHAISCLLHVDADKDEGEGVKFAIRPGVHSYKKSEFVAMASVLTVSESKPRLLPEVEYFAPKPKPGGGGGGPAPKPGPRAIKKTIGPAWTTGGVVSGDGRYVEVGFRIPEIKGHTISSIVVTGTCTWDMYDSGKGIWYPCRLSGESKTVFVRDYSNFSVGFGPNAAAFLKSNGWANFKIGPRSPYTTFNPHSFRLHVTYWA